MVTLDGASAARRPWGLLQAPGAAPDSGADTSPLDSGSELGQRDTRGLTLPPRATVAGAHSHALSVPRRTLCDSASITAPPAPLWPRSIGAIIRWSVFR